MNANQREYGASPSGASDGEPDMHGTARWRNSLVERFIGRMFLPSNLVSGTHPHFAPHHPRQGASFRM